MGGLGNLGWVMGGTPGWNWSMGRDEAVRASWGGSWAYIGHPWGNHPSQVTNPPPRPSVAKAGDTPVLALSAQGEQGPSWGHPEANSPQCHLLPGTTSPSQLFEDIFWYLIKFAINQGSRRQPEIP